MESSPVCVGGTRLMPAAWTRHSHIWHLLLTCSDALVFDASRSKLKRYLHLACACRATHFAVAISWPHLAQKAQEQVRDAADPVFCDTIERVAVISAQRVRASMSSDLSSRSSRCSCLQARIEHTSRILGFVPSEDGEKALQPPLNQKSLGP
jgi:hypothetical protein